MTNSDPHETHGRQGRFFATAAKGTEGLLAEELDELALPAVRAARGGVYFGTAPEHALSACLWTRIALRVLEPLGEFECRHADDLYDGVSAVDWSRYFGGDQTLSVRASGHGPTLTHTHFIAVRTKDAIVDQLRERHGRRPSVDRDAADVTLFVHLARERATINVEYSGGSLHEHGYRGQHGSGGAPLRENLAAALVRFSGWRGDTPLTDPMCGSGTLLLEAGLWAARRAPGLDKRFGFQRWSCFDESSARTWNDLREAAAAAARPVPLLFGSDLDPKALERARAAAERAGVAVDLCVSPLDAVKPQHGEGGLLLNPPYGERLAKPKGLEVDVGRVLERFEAHQRGAIVPVDFPVSVSASRWLSVFNGALECEFRRYDARPSTRASG